MSIFEAVILHIPSTLRYPPSSLYGASGHVLRSLSARNQSHASSTSTTCRTFSSIYCRGQQAAAHAPEPDADRGSQERAATGSIAEELDRGVGHTEDRPSPSPQTYRYASSLTQRVREDSRDAVQASQTTDALDGLGVAATGSNTGDGRVFRSLLFPAQSSASQKTRPLPPPPPIDQTVYATMNLSSRVGKSLPVDQSRPANLAIQLKRLAMLVARNGVARDHFRQRFHERPGLKRKRLKSERWRKHFKQQFESTVRRVQKLRGKGW